MLCTVSSSSTYSPHSERTQRCDETTAPNRFQRLSSSTSEACERVCQADIIGDVAANALEHCVGVANDHAVEAHESGRLEKGALLVMWEQVVAYIRS